VSLSWLVPAGLAASVASPLRRATNYKIRDKIGNLVIVPLRAKSEKDRADLNMFVNYPPAYVLIILSVNSWCII